MLTQSEMFHGNEFAKRKSINSFKKLTLANVKIRTS